MKHLALRRLLIGLLLLTYPSTVATGRIMYAVLAQNLIFEANPAKKQPF